MKTPEAADAASASPARKRTKTRPAARRRTIENTYSDPALRERLKEEIRAAAKGGEPGTWSARKSQLLTLAYQKQGGGYLQRHPNSKQRDLSEWTKQDWQTSDGKPARRASGTTRYLPKKAWGELDAGEKKATNAKKKAGSKAGEHTVANTAAAKRARKHAE
ncbi:hypothetical protein HHL22_18780 [Hymenobacter sp. RP-2-7]|uniref:DUF5872 domain-containing protein n=1 Tax=Hymenobacter polaris TaxID=2682546 RepID=A0A7Y0AH88_9BACT|nr:hypothetical protein [Hymenobacter polaris]NML67254.1 hypothetical protein [Hymenobacter polaris]